MKFINEIGGKNTEIISIFARFYHEVCYSRHINLFFGVGDGLFLLLQEEECGAFGP